MSVTDELLRNNESYAASFDKGDLPLPPGKKVAVLACMDARLNPYGALGLQEGDAHVIRNAGGVVTDDEIRSLAISQRLLGTEEIILIHHTDCGMLTFTDDEFKRSIQDDVGIKPEWAVEAFPDLDEDVRQSIARIKASPFIPRKELRRGLRLRRRLGQTGDRLRPAARGPHHSSSNTAGASATNARASSSPTNTCTLRPSGGAVAKILPPTRKEVISKCGSSVASGKERANFLTWARFMAAKIVRQGGEHPYPVPVHRRP
jgi:carbonic anhydrase